MPDFDFERLPVPAALLDRGLVVRAFRSGAATRANQPALRAGRSLTAGLSPDQATALQAAEKVAQQLGAFRGAVMLPAHAGGAVAWDCLWFPSEQGSLALFLARSAVDHDAGHGNRSERPLHEAWRLAALDAFAGACAHEMAQPLASAEAAAAALSLLHPAAPGLAALEQLRSAVARAAELLQALRRQAQTPAVEPAAIDAVAEVRSALRRLDAPPTVRFAPPAGLPRVAAAAHVVELIALNLVRNALTAVAGVAKPAVVVELTLRDERLELSVSDNGPGVPTELLPTLFSPFGTRRAAGMGLPMSRRLAELYGGGLRLRANQPQRGAAFAADLPLAPMVRTAGVP